MRILFTLTLFLSSALLFLVQPMVAKMVLPPFGGAPMVWNASMLFFQAILLLGYGYAHLSTKWLGRRRQVIVHCCLMVAAVITLPIAIPAGYGALGSGSPLGPLMAALTIGVGIVFFALSAGAPVIQKWFAGTSDPQAKDPYFLYAASNLGSMLALLAYPTLIEPRLRLHDQANLWRWMYVALVVLMVGIGALALKSLSNAPAEVVAEPVGETPWSQRLRWIAFAFIPSSLMLGLTTYFTSNIAPVPLLWVIPLSLYLLTFIIAFARKRILKTEWIGRALPLLVTPLVLAIIIESDDYLIGVGVLHLLVFFVAALLCHSRLVDERPEPSKLTEFYLWMSVGGVLGGIFNTIVAPFIFTVISEYPLMIVLACLARPWPKPGTVRNKFDFIYPAAVAALVAIFILSWNRLDASLFTGLLYDRGGALPDLVSKLTVRNLLIIGIPTVLAFLAVDRPIRFGLSIGAVLFMCAQMQLNLTSKGLLTSRNFFGVHRVSLQEGYYKGQFFHLLVNGNTIHGKQSLNPDRRRTPLTYYGRQSPVGQVMTFFSGHRAKKNIGLIGLGVGTLAAYGEPGQTITFHEIDPQIRKIAEDPKLFTYLQDSRAKINIVMGDARSTIAQEANPQYGIIVVDAFSSDSIPVHLITKEAVTMLMSKMEPDGVLLYHISNRYLNLEPVLGNIAQELKLYAITQYTSVSAEELILGYSHARYVALCAKPETLEQFAKKNLWSQAETDPKIGVWSDEFSNIFSVFEK